MLRGRIEAERVAVIVAHPDDETIGCGALLSRMDGVRIVHVTDGAPRDLVDAKREGFRSAQEYASARRRELCAAMSFVGVPESALTALNIPDKEAVRHMARLSVVLADFIYDRHIRLVLTHAYEGGHPDHDATAFAVHQAVRLVRKERPVTIVEMPLYRLGPEGWVGQNFVPYPGCPVTTLDLTLQERALKARMFAAYQSQASALSGFHTEREYVRPAPSYVFTRLPNEGRLLYETFGWGIHGDYWLRAVRHAFGVLERDYGLRP